MQNDVLFYPQISLTDPKLIKSLVLLYDNVYRICPDNIIPDDHADLHELLAEGCVGRTIDPVIYAEEASSKFLEGLEYWNADALYVDDENISRLHVDKTDQIIREMFRDIGFKEQNGWMYVPTEFAENFMLFMAKEVATKNKLALCTSSMSAWTATNYFGIDGGIHDNPMLPGFDNEYTDDPFGLFNMLITELTPVNISEIPSDKILEFKLKRRDEILNFRKCIFDLKSEIESTIDKDISIDRIEKKAKQLACAQSDYKKSADIIGAKKWFGSSMMGVPASIGLCSLLSIPTAATIMLAGTGVALGGLYNLATSKEDLKKLNNENSASFLVELERDFKGHFRGRGSRSPGDINMTAWNSMEEYVAD
jgi:hypothetical protein